jgi:23S rRNA (pseudouridine1915-N3)-methyltransferase
VKLHVLAVGHRPPAWVAAGFEDYARRMPKELPIELLELKPGRRDGDSAGQIARARSEEAERIVAAIPGGSVKIALDERGKALSTLQVARQIELWMGDGRDVCFIIGGADGLDDGIKRGADLLLSLSALTMPHALVRVVLAEQLYRAAMLIRNHPYHRQ